MKQASIKVKNYIERVDTIDQNIDLRSKVLYGIFSMFILFSFLYVFVLGNMVFNIIERKTVDLEARNLANEVASLEANYLILVNNLDQASSFALGLKEIKPIFANRSNASLTLNSSLLAQNEI